MADRWNEFWFAEIPPDIYAALRITFAVLGCLTLIGLSDLRLFWSCDGLVASRDSSVCRSLVSLGLGWLPGYAALVYSAISFLMMAAGYKSRLSVVLAFVSLSSIARWNDLPLSAAHQVLRSLLFCLLWADCGQRWSVDAWLRGRNVRTPTERHVAIWPLRLIQIQIAGIYLITGLWKLENLAWRDGSALHYILQTPQFARFTMLGSPAWDAWTTGATYLTLGWELGFPLLVLHPLTRRWTLWLGVVLHLGMWATLELGLFSGVMIGSYIAFLDPDRLRAEIRRWGRLPVLARNTDR